jgi:hypothetical protein
VEINKIKVDLAEKMGKKQMVDHIAKATFNVS